MSNSIRSRLLVGTLKLMGFKSMFSKSAEELLESVKKENEKCQFKIPKDTSYHYFDVPILENYHCLRMQKEEEPQKKAILFFFGGGFIRGCSDGAVKSAKKYGERSGRDVWLPYYPLCTDHCVKDTYAMVFETYKTMLKVYDSKNIALVGFSSGGAIALGLCCHINYVNAHPTTPETETPGTIPMPGLIIASSPGSVPYTEEEKKKMEELNPLDVMLDQHFMVNVIKGIMVKDQEVPDYMVHTVLGDFTNLPMTHVYYATHEILYAEAEYFENAFKKYNVPYEMHIKEGMFHCYPSFTFYPEGREAEDQMIGYLSN